MTVASAKLRVGHNEDLSASKALLFILVEVSMKSLQGAINVRGGVTT